MTRNDRISNNTAHIRRNWNFVTGKAPATVIMTPRQKVRTSVRTTTGNEGTNRGTVFNKLWRKGRTRILGLRNQLNEITARIGRMLVNGLVVCTVRPPQNLINTGNRSVNTMSQIAIPRFSRIINSHARQRNDSSSRHRSPHYYHQS